MSTPEQERREELAALASIGLLDPGERAEYERALASDPAFAAEVRTLGTVAGALAYTVPQVDPPAGLRGRILASIAGRDVPPAAEPAPRVIPMATAPRRASALPAWLAAAAALLLALGLGAYGLQVRTQVTEMSRRVADSEQEVLRLRNVLGEEQRKTQFLQAQAEVLAAPDLARVDLAGQTTAPSASARAFWSRRSGMVFAARALPPLPSKRIYQVWVVAGQKPISAGLLRPDPNGNATVHFSTPPDIPTPVAVAVTLEPEGGVPQPTGEKVLVGAVGI
jgi:anti-sigma-K factor RskA